VNRLLIIDRYSSYVNIEFITIYDWLKILILILPPYSTHYLQPLDVGCFLPLSTCYSTELDKVMEKSGGLVTFTKIMFWSTFKAAWDWSLTEANILSDLRKRVYDPISLVLFYLLLFPHVRKLLLKHL
jgi:hypothetical protein